LSNNIYPSDRRGVIVHFEAINQYNYDTFHVEFRVTHPTNGLIWLSLSVLITKRDENFKPKQLIGLFEDITERINVQQELIKAKEKAEESDRIKTAYLANMSHKIRTPMNSIVGFANLLTEEDVTQQEKDTFIRIISHDSEQLLRLIDDIINIAKIDADQMGFSEKHVSVNNLFAELSDYYKANEKTNAIRFETRTMLPNGKDFITTDGDKLKLIVSNLLNNAFKFTAQGNIELGYYINPVTKKLIIYVKDTGIGIPEISKDKIFNRFYQADSETEGTGLGLTISQGLVKLLKGTLTFESKEGEGTSFFVELPFNEA
jgi:signal transduction histidine kinase